IGVTAAAKTGKAQPLSTKIKTPTGWTTMGELNVGDRVASIDGKESTVTGVFPQGSKKTYRIFFSDGRSTKASGDHLWSVYKTYTSDHTQIVVTTEALIQLLSITKRKTLWAIPRISGVFDEDYLAPLDIHPYVLGVLLGDGDITQPTPSVHSRDKEIEDKV